MHHAISSASRGSREENFRGAKIGGEKDERGAMQFQVQAGLQGRNVKGAKLTKKRTRGAPCSFKCKQGLQGRKRQGRQVDGEKDERCGMQFQVQAGAPGKKNFRDAKSRTRGVPCSFKCKQGLQGRKCQGRQIDGEKEIKSLIVKLISLLASK